MEKNKKQMEYLNTLRFLSVVLILFTHYNYQCYSLYVNNNILSTFFTIIICGHILSHLE